MLLGLSCVISAACVSNNVTDIHIDKKMARTKQRALVQGIISTKNAVRLAGVLLIIGTVILGLTTSLLAAVLSLVGFIAYVWIYGCAKRATRHGTIIGSLSGAIPPLVGFASFQGKLDYSAILLFLILVFWQMPHFYAIAIFQLEDYKAAGIPVLPAVSSLAVTKLQMMLYVVCFSCSVFLLAISGYTGYLFAVIALLLSVFWLYIGLRSYRLPDSIAWSRRMFAASLAVITGLCFAISLDSFRQSVGF